MLMGVTCSSSASSWKSNCDGRPLPALFIDVGLALWTFFAAAVQSSTRSMLDNAN
jgi:hypothetical protein